MLSRFVWNKNHRGFTLVEILVALLILAMILVAILPLFVMVNRVMYDNRDRLIATQLAKNVIESISSQVTPDNYNSSTGPLVPGISIKYLDRNFNAVDEDSGDLTFTVTTSIGWVDDPDDDSSPTDPIPFDYKEIEVTVTAPSIFDGEVKEKADFKTYRAREGAADPISGVLVQVNRAWCTDPDNPPPVSGAVVIVTDPDGTTYTDITDVEGRALIQIEPSDDSDVVTYNIKASKSGLILNPNYSDGANESINRYSTEMVELQMEEPASITLNLGSEHQGGTVVLSGSYGTPISVDVAAGEQQVTFTGLWPAGTAGNISGAYNLDAENMVIYNNDFSSLSDFIRWQEDSGSVYNLWTFDNVESKWTAEYDPGKTYNPYNRLGLTISGLDQFQPGDGFEVDTDETDGYELIYLVGDEFIIGEGSESSDYVIIHKSRSDQPLSSLITSDTDWEDVSTLSDALAVVADPYDNNEIYLISEDLGSSSLKLRFDTTTQIGYVKFGPLSIRASYTNPNITFTSAGQDLTLSLFAAGG